MFTTVRHCTKSKAGDCVLNNVHAVSWKFIDYTSTFAAEYDIFPEDRIVLALIVGLKIVHTHDISPQLF